MTLKNTDCYDIIVVNRQTIDGESDSIEEKSSGKYFLSDRKKYIMYKTPETSTTIIISKDEIRIKRRGGINSDMLFRENTKTRFLYRVPYGSIEMSINTLEISDELSEEGGAVNLVYTLTAQSSEYYNNMKITVSKR